MPEKVGHGASGPQRRDDPQHLLVTGGQRQVARAKSDDDFTHLVSPEGESRFMRALAATEPFHQAVNGPHWYLLAVGVACYLETGTQSNIDYYTKRGFEIVGQTQFDAHTLTGMVRHPASNQLPENGPEFLSARISPAWPSRP